MAEIGKAGMDVAALSQALESARKSLASALNQIGEPGRARLDDQNTGCQNSGCGGAAAVTDQLEQRQ